VMAVAALTGCCGGHGWRQQVTGHSEGLAPCSKRVWRPAAMRFWRPAVMRVWRPAAKGWRPAAMRVWRPAAKTTEQQRITTVSLELLFTSARFRLNITVKKILKIFYHFK
jgi:hypothetical protein